MRPVPYPSMLGALAENVRQRRSDPWLFEVGKTYRTGGSRGPATAETAGSGRWRPGTLAIGAAGTARAAAFGQSRARRGRGNAEGPGRRAARRPRRAATARIAPRHRRSAIRICTPVARRESSTPPRRDYGSLGEVHPRVAEAWGLPGRPVIASLNLGALLSLVPDEVLVRPVPAAQPVDRDLAVSVDEATPLGELLRVLRTSAGPTAGRGAAVRRLPRPAGRRGARVIRHRAPLPAGEGRRREERWSGP